MDEPQNNIEEWRPIPGWGFYEASTHGRIRSLHRRATERVIVPRVIRSWRNRQGYMYVGLVKSPGMRQKFLFVHRLIASTFIGPLPEGRQVDHVDGNKNNNRPGNLEYVTQSENILRSFRLGRIPLRGENIPGAKLTEELVRDIRNSPLTSHAIADSTGISVWTIYDARSRRTWKHVE